MSIEIDRGYRDRGVAPLYSQYDGQLQPQDAYIELDEDGTVRADYSGEIGNAVPMTVYHGRTLRWPVSPTISKDGLDLLLEEIGPLLERVHAGHSIEWDGSNHVGRLTYDAHIETRKVGHRCSEYGWDAHYHADVYDARDWVASDWEETVADYRDATDRRAYIQSLIADAASGDQMLANVDRLVRELDKAIEASE